jgi:hypothetical protein
MRQSRSEVYEWQPLAAGSQQRLIKFYIAAFLTAKVVFLFLLAYQSRFVMDEFKQGGQPFFISKGFYENIFPVKTVLYAYFYQIAYLLSSNSFQIMLISRFQTALLGCMTLYFLYLIARNLGRERLESLFILCVALAFSTFMERIFRVRSEPLALVFAIVSLWLLTIEKQTATKILVAGLFAGASFLTTQKSVYFNLALGSGLVVDALITDSIGSAAKKAFLLLGGWCAALVLYSFYFRGIYLYEVIAQVFTRSTDLYLHGAAYYHFGGYIVMTVGRDFLFYFLGIWGWLLAGRKVRRMDGPERIAWVFSGMITCFIFTHNQPWPYVFVSCIPFIALWSDRPLAWLGKYIRRRYLTAILVVITALSFVRNFYYLSHSNLLQREVVTQAQSLLSTQQAYCDGIGMVVNRERPFRAWWDRRKRAKILQDTDAGRGREVEEVFSGQQKLWILNYRTTALKEVLSPFFTHSYVRIFPNILISGCQVTSSSETVFMNRWVGAYRLFSREGQTLDNCFSLNGKTACGTVELPLGENLIRVNGSSSIVYLLPADISVPFRIPTGMSQLPLFANVYTY